MQLITKKISTQNSTLNQLIIELQEECQNVLSLINQLQLSELSDRQKGQILSELLVASIHLHSHCDEDWQNLISDELESLTDDEN
ncbi:MAG: hypothetical protein J7545_00895 [Roseofilum sp. SBFL]|uniref:hypothetical protein n=1 Tax=unclassified Roseofilum TaxID=2620099 RepID=UPI001B1F5052|nr:MULTISPECIES: hypothetical protein [unclassified Roseofilum]MBP0015519.1 hypothetical protein [Roseofilum sp. SID3]MBP0025566.1 hypothetical protein [Roseofilum sp. SID2]MBP0036601.1 hypothetical protein [Roseofilum sp. SID1]MBP0040524.1 hypothetical protein [Roseofilum sp. SBFL]